MTITLEQIDNLRARADVTYAQAKEALEINNGHLIDAIIYLESEQETLNDDNTEKNKSRDSRANQKRPTKNTGDDLIDGLKKIFKTLNETRVIMFNNERTIFDVSMTITILVGLFAFPLIVTILVVGLLTGNRFNIKRKSKLTETVNDIFDKASKMTEEAKNKFKEDKTSSED